MKMATLSFKQGVPLPLFIDKKTGKPLKDENVINRIADTLKSLRS